VTRTLNNYAQKNNLFKKETFQLSGEDVREGLTAVISVKVSEPQFEGQTKTKLVIQKSRVSSIRLFPKVCRNIWKEIRPRVVALLKKA
jgi:DNA gyrase subunit B